MLYMTNLFDHTQPIQIAFSFKLQAYFKSIAGFLAPDDLACQVTFLFQNWNRYPNCRQNLKRFSGNKRKTAEAQISQGFISRIISIIPNQL